MMKPCMDCGTPSNGTRCPTHQAQRQQILQQGQNVRRANTPGRSKYGGAYAKGARGVRANATVCWLCGGGPQPDDPWQADHVIQSNRAGEGGGGLAPAHRSCNIRRRHLAAKGWAHPRIVERLELLRNGPTNHTTGPRAGGTHPDPGQRLAQRPSDDPAPFAGRDAYGVGPSGGGAA